ncbi:hypothetical protein [Leptospira stimsonii]|uniref:Lipoprotein n=1 Tax=Leptospira stimsonii TaxID=2202203 RepID=A0ABY2MUJ7_9LEPT|nr:hypothetical protein [Leptospira stimsonii]TGK23645.1 hypothetical protein EHO98_04750 [Leptospira stimsonii]TGM08044.1 hypothetical protein EHQ90_23075 [Leptospira stimsonii]
MKIISQSAISLLILSAFLTCSKSKDHKNDTILALLSLLSVPKGISVQFSGESSGSANSKINESAEENRLKAIYFGQLKIYAHTYVPQKGKELYSTVSIKPGTVLDWTTTMILGQSFNGPYGGNDNLVKTNEVVDIDSWMNNFDAKFINGKFQAYLNETSAFKVDLLELNLYRTGLILDDKFYNLTISGQYETKDYLYKYPDYTSLEMVPFQKSSDAGLKLCDVCDLRSGIIGVIMLTRRELIGTVLYVKKTNENFEAGTYDLEYSRAVTAAERNIVESIFKHQKSAHYGRGFQSLAFVPADLPLISRDGSGITPEDLAIRVKFDLSKAIDFDPVKTDLSAAKITFAEDANSVPMGLSVEVIDKSKK